MKRYWSRFKNISYLQIGICVHKFLSFCHDHGCKDGANAAFTVVFLPTLKLSFTVCKTQFLFIKEYYPAHVIQNKSWRHPLLTTSCKLESKSMLSAVTSSSTFQRCAMTFSLAKAYIGWLKVLRMQNLVRGKRNPFACYRAEVGVLSALACVIPITWWLAISMSPK